MDNTNEAMYIGLVEDYDNYNEHAYQPTPDKFETVEEFTEWCRQDG